MKTLKELMKARRALEDKIESLQQEEHRKKLEQISSKRKKDFEQRFKSIQQKAKDCLGKVLIVNKGYFSLVSEVRVLRTSDLVCSVRVTCDNIKHSIYLKPDTASDSLDVYSFKSNDSLEISDGRDITWFESATIIDPGRFQALSENLERIKTHLKEMRNL